MSLSVQQFPVDLQSVVYSSQPHMGIIELITKDEMSYINKLTKLKQLISSNNQIGQLCLYGLFHQGP
jgi:hypothetical protein